MPLRFDKSELQRPTLDQNGYLVADALVTRAGVFVYHHPNGTTTRELRHPDDVFKADSLKSLANRPVTDGHPHPGKLDTKNTKLFSIGNLIDQPEKTDDGFVKARLMVTDQVGIDKIMREEKPVREVSCGYTCDTEPEEGTFQGEKYDHRQKNIIYNHVAIVDKGRAGPKARLVLDADDGAVEGVDIELKTDENKNKERKTMVKVKFVRPAVVKGAFKVDALSFEVEESAQPIVEGLMTTMDRAYDHIDALQAKADTLQGTIDELKEKADIKPEVLAVLVKERADVLGVAAHVGVSDNLDAASVPEIKKMVVAQANKGLKLDDQSEAYVQGRYDSIVDKIKGEHEGLTSLATLRKATSGDGVHRKLDADDDKKEVKIDDLPPRERLAAKTEKMWETTGA